MEVTFSNPFFLVFLVSIPLMIISHLFTLRYLKRRAFKFANFEAIKRVVGETKPITSNTYILSQNLPLLITRILLISVLVLSAAGMVFWSFGQSSDFNYVLAIDASSSMLADDFYPSRLEAAKSASINFVDSVSSETTVGIVSFSGAAFIETELTSNRGDVKDKIRSVDIKSVGGTDIGEAIITSTNVLLKEEKARVIVLLTDGQSNVGTSVYDAIDYANDNQVIVYTIGVATKEGGSFMRIKSISQLDEETLVEIAQRTGGEYFRAEDRTALSKAFREIAFSHRESIPTNLSMGLLLVALVLIFLEWGLISTKYKSIP